MFDSVVYWATLASLAYIVAHLPRVAKDWAIIAASIIACGMLDLRGLLILSILIAITAIILERRQKSPDSAPHGEVVFGITAVLVTLIVFKYLPVISWFNVGRTPDWIMPLGISFLAFRLIHVLVDAQRKTLPAFHVREFVLYSVFFPIWIAGPIQRFDEFLRDRSDKIDLKVWIYGLYRCSLGLLKVFLISDFVLPTLYAVSQTPDLVAGQIDVMTASETWRYLGVTYFILYLDFSGYTDMAIGSARLLGFKCAENFNLPFLATNMSDYWRRWHMSLARWCQTYVYMPVLVRTRSATLPLFATFLLMGIWHAAAPHWLMWGLWHVCGVLAFRFWDVTLRKIETTRGSRLRPAPIVGNAVTLAYVMCAGAFTSLHHQAPVTDGFRLLANAISF